MTEAEARLEQANQRAHKRVVLAFVIIVILGSVVLFASRFSAFNEHPHHDETTRIGGESDPGYEPSLIGEVGGPSEGSGETGD